MFVEVVDQWGENQVYGDVLDVDVSGGAIVLRRNDGIHARPVVVVLTPAVYRSATWVEAAP